VQRKTGFVRSLSRGRNRSFSRADLPAGAETKKMAKHPSQVSLSRDVLQTITFEIVKKSMMKRKRESLSIEEETNQDLLQFWAQS